eukprot:scaffold22261_cov72-Skeletonema_dohrnii-CCMP3373.AAC.1
MAMTMKVENESKEHESKEHAALTFWAETTPFLIIFLFLPSLYPFFEFTVVRVQQESFYKIIFAGNDEMVQ